MSIMPGGSPPKEDRWNRALRAWFDMTTDRAVRESRLPRSVAERYVHYFDASKADGDFMSRREYYAYQIAKGVVGELFNYRLLLWLLVSFIAGLGFGYRVGQMRGFW
jgi:hypothetical protein